MKFSVTNHKVRNLSRISKVANILIQNGFEDFVVSTGLNRFLPDGYKSNADKPSESLNRWQRIRAAIEQLGPTMIKFANYLSCRPDILPQQLLTEFASMQTGVEPFGKSVAIKIFEQATKLSVDKVFSYFDNYSFFCEGYGCSFRAKLLTGEDVAVKVLMPNAKTVVLTDLTLIRDFVSLTESYLISIGIHRPLEIVDMFEDSILPQLDFRNEADMIRRFAMAYQKKSGLVVPQVFSRFTTEQTIVTEYFNAVDAADSFEFTSWGINRKSTADNFLKIFVSGLLETGVFHCSPSTSIVAVLPDGRIALSDFSYTEMLTSEQRSYLCDVVAALSTRNSRVLSESLRKLAVGGEIDDYQIFRNEIQRLADDLAYLADDVFFMRQFSFGISRIAYSQKLSLPREVLEAFSALASAESVAREIYPKVSVPELFKPYGTKLFLEKFTPDKVKSRVSQNLSQAADLLETSPLELSVILKKLRHGKLTANHKVIGLGFLIKKLDTAVNKLVYAIIIAALIIGSSMLMLSDSGIYKILGFPLASIIGYALALVLAISLLTYTVRNRFSNKENIDS